ncbi:MAG: SCP2 sterol-binding domain-containing protein [Actinomycetota bacterium]
MAVKYLTEEWATAMTDAINSSDDFKSAASGQSAKLQQVVTDTPDGGETKYYFNLEGGSATVGLGELEGAEATISQNYETSVALDKGELNPQQAFMQGKIKVTGNMMKLMQLQGVINALPKAASSVERDY